MDTNVDNCYYCGFETDVMADGEGHLSCQECRDMNTLLEDHWDYLCSTLNILQDKEAKAAIRRYGDLRVGRSKMSEGRNN